MDKISPEEVTDGTELGEEFVSKHFQYPIYDKDDDYPEVVCFRLTKDRLCLISHRSIIVKEESKETDDEII